MNTNSPGKTDYDYIIAGAGCAGLSLAVHLIHSGEFTGKKILLIDKASKTSNDRTWCFWETTPGLFESIVYKKWENAWFHGQQFSRLLSLSPYIYKLIRGIDFYDYCLGQIKSHPNFEILHEEIRAIEPEGKNGWVETNKGKITAEYIFSSITTAHPPLKKREYNLLQQFKGWTIETDKASFPAEATLMDFRVSQDRGTAFVYVMPFNENKALVEYTLFSKSLLTARQYDEGLNDYIHGVMNISQFNVLEEEFGVIPMTNRKFPQRKGSIFYIGAAGGQTKASSGYTFQFIQKHSAALVNHLAKDGRSFVHRIPGRFAFYDSILLNILHHERLPGEQIFSRLFKTNPPSKVLRFLDNESSFTDEWKIISSLPTLPFLRAAIEQL